ncbi:MAG: hypothetical protein DCF15_21140 [Phormidesmis priestleyi]|uniref:UspA domain-containing protein n=1 Tax=Phormidesmis priestleyi TaxID=268141 RepID=A0A2W4WRS8_9CYAN|nr:MAG: hypothetical protein DCF15_21140 [Phormidesmis priestleyi]
MVLFAKDRILVPIDFSEKSLQALTETLTFAEGFSNVYVVHVLKPLEVTEPGVVWDSINDAKRAETIQKLFVLPINANLTCARYKHCQFSYHGSLNPMALAYTAL